MIFFWGRVLCDELNNSWEVDKKKGIEKMEIYYIRLSIMDR